MILFIDTHDSLITIALKTKSKLFIKTQESEYSHSIYVMPMIKDLFEENKQNIKDLTQIIVVNGPGSFTGIRIGLSIAKTIAYALNIKINTISSLTAYLVSSDLDCDKMAVIEDNKGYYISVFDKDNKPVIEEFYSEQNDYSGKYLVVKHDIDVNKIVEYVSNIKSENPHFIKANYIKKIEVEK